MNPFHQRGARDEVKDEAKDGVKDDAKDEPCEMSATAPTSTSHAPSAAPPTTSTAPNPTPLGVPVAFLAQGGGPERAL